MAGDYSAVFIADVTPGRLGKIPIAFSTSQHKFCTIAIGLTSGLKPYKSFSQTGSLTFTRFLVFRSHVCSVYRFGAHVEQHRADKTI